MRGLEDMQYYCDIQDGMFIGRVREFPGLRTKPQVKRIDAISDIITLTARRIREIHESQATGR